MNVKPATEKQVAFLAKLASERGIESPFTATMTSREASREIDRLLAMPKVKAVRVEADADTPAPGHYAADYNGVLRFYRVVEGKGRWEGRIFLNRFRSDYQDRVGAAERRAVYAAINADPEAAGERFALETRHCRRCGRRLTDIPAAERNGGYGPECVKAV